MASTFNRNLRVFMRLDAQNRVIAGSGVQRKSKPKDGKWLEIPEGLCCDPLVVDKTTTTTTTSTSTSSTTSTTTTSPSDFRLKMNITSTGNTIGGFNEYTWEWNSTAIALGLDHYPRKGVMAQELVNAGSDAVFMGEDGFYRVDYSKIV